MNKLLHITFLIVFITYNKSLFSQERKIYNVRNCQGEMRTTTFQNQIQFFNRWVYGKANFKEQKILNFSKGYKIDSLSLYNQILKIRGTLPKSFFTAGNFFGDWYNNLPDEKSIWFTQAFAEKDQQGNFKVFSAFKIIFEGNNAHNDIQRTDPKIKDIEFIFDKDQLLQLSKKLKLLSPL